MKIAVLELKIHDLFQKMHFLWDSNLQLETQFFTLLKKDTLQDP